MLKMMNKHLLLLFFVLCLSASQVFGQGWIRNFDGDNSPWFVDVAPGLEGEVYTLATTGQDEIHVRRWDADGDLVWEHSEFGGFVTNVNRLIANSDGSVIAAFCSPFNYKYAPTLIKLDINGNLIWKEQYAGNDTLFGSEFLDFVQLSDQNLLLGTGDNDSFLLKKINPISGQPIWEKRFAPALPCENAALQRMAINSSGNILASAATIDSFHTILESELIWLNSLGELQGRRVFVGNDTLLHDIKALPDGNFVLTVSTFYIQQCWKINSFGQILWVKTFPNASFKSTLVVNPIGEIIVSTTSTSGQDIAFIKLDSNGNEISNTPQLLLGQTEFIRSMSFAPDGSFLVAGRYVDYVNWKAFVIKIPANGQLFTSLIRGKIAIDANDNCLTETTEIPLSGWTVKAEKGGFTYDYYAFTDSSGEYEFPVENGDWLLTCRPPNNYWQTCKPLAQNLALIDKDTIIDFPTHADINCPLLEVDVSTPFLRRCFENKYNVNYCNRGTSVAENIYIHLTVDSYLDVQNFSIPALDLGGNNWKIEVADLPIGQCGAFSFLATPNCDSAIIGQTHCVEAHIYPDSICTPLSGAWLGASIQVRGDCVGDSVVFTIKNIGTGTTIGTNEYVIIEDDLILREGNFNLSAGDSIVQTVLANGAFFRCEAEQEPNHPGISMPSAAVEGCGLNAQGTFSLGFQTQFNENDGDPFVSIDCQQNQGSFDPNDKQGFPIGALEEHYILPGQDLEYLIRFQNTGTDTAFRVVLRDTLNTWLDPMSVELGSASHAFRYDLLLGAVMKFTFDNILLPDSNVNEAASHGYIKFRIKQKSNVPLGTVISNWAGIYFDFNAPVITNIVFHTVDTGFLTIKIVDAIEEKHKNLALLVYPNPTKEIVLITLKNQGFQGFQDFVNLRIQLRNSLGNVLIERDFNGNQLEIQRNGLLNGIYFLEILEGNNVVGSGKLVFEK
jgi:uncharacterized repeat protein (TIGR01451 family)